jgi:hypothetical protein
MLVEKVNPLCTKVEKHDVSLYNSGWGIASQVKVLWLLAGGLWALCLVYLRNKI